MSPIQCTHAGWGGQIAAEPPGPGDFIILNASKLRPSSVSFALGPQNSLKGPARMNMCMSYV